MARFHRITDAEALGARTDPKLRDLVVRACDRLVHHWARKMYAKSDEDFEDLLQEGSMAVLRAIDTFKVLPHRRAKHAHFAGWATHWIRAYMWRRRWGNPVSPKALDYASSLDTPFDHDDGDEGETYLDRLREENAPDPEHAASWAELKAKVEERVARMPERLRLIYEFRVRHEVSLSDIGDMLGLSRERVRQQMNAIIERLARLPEASVEDLEHLQYVWHRQRTSVGSRAREGVHARRADLPRPRKARPSKEERAREGRQARRLR